MAPLILHIINRLAVGGLENGLINLINHTPAERYQHAILSLTDVTEYSNRLSRPIPVISIGRRNGIDWRSHISVWKIIRHLRPAIVHTRNLPGMEYLIPAFVAGVPCRIHGEHGRDQHDGYGSDRKLNHWRKMVKIFAHHYSAVSMDLAKWLEEVIGIPKDRITQIYNGVDLGRFHPYVGPRRESGALPFPDSDLFVVGTVGRMQPVKNQTLLVRAFLHALSCLGSGGSRLRLVLIGDGPLRSDCLNMVKKAQVEHLVWAPGEREEIPIILRNLDLFVLPSDAEGISNTILEAMASGLPVLATNVGGNPELVEDQITGTLVGSGDVVGMAQAITRYATDAELCRKQGQAGRLRVERYFSLDAMVKRYLDMYDRLLNAHIHSAVRTVPTTLMCCDRDPSSSHTGRTQ